MSCFLHAVKQNGVRCIGRHTCPDVNTSLRWVSVEFDFTLVAEGLLSKKSPACQREKRQRQANANTTDLGMWSVHLQAPKVSQAREYFIFWGWPNSCHTGTVPQFLVPIAKSHCRCRAHARRPNPKSQKKSNQLCVACGGSAFDHLPVLIRGFCGAFLQERLPDALFVKRTASTCIFAGRVPAGVSTGISALATTGPWASMA